MKRFLIVSGLVLASLVVAQTAVTTIGNFSLNPDKSIGLPELNTARGAVLGMNCVEGKLEVNFQPQVKLPSSDVVSVNYNFDAAAVVTKSWNVGPFGGTLFLPKDSTRDFLMAGKTATSLYISMLDADKIEQKYQFNLGGFNDAVGTLACSAEFGFTPPPPVVTMPISVLDKDMAFISPAEFVKTFPGGGSFKPENGMLAWEFNGVKLVFKKGFTAARNVRNNAVVYFARPVNEVKGRTVVPVSAVSVFKCKVIGKTTPLDAKVKIGCGAGQSYIEHELTRY